jgi:hypothetical protein
VVARYSLGSNPDSADPGGEEVILAVARPFADHNGGQPAFGPDGFLYIGMGDGGSGGDPNHYAQNLNDLPGNRELPGKLLRIDVEPLRDPGSEPLARRNPKGDLGPRALIREIQSLTLKSEAKSSPPRPNGRLPQRARPPRLAGDFPDFYLLSVVL